MTSSKIQEIGIPITGMLAIVQIASFTLFTPDALAQTAAAKPAKKVKPPAQIEMENYYQRLTKAPSLPDVPDIGSAAKFRFGLERSDKTGLTSVGLRYGTRSTPQQLIDYYKQSLIAQQWKLNTVSTTSVQANKGDKSLVINIMPKGSMDVTTDYMLNYSYKAR